MNLSLCLIWSLCDCPRFRSFISYDSCMYGIRRILLFSFCIFMWHNFLWICLCEILISFSVLNFVLLLIKHHLFSTKVRLLINLTSKFWITLKTSLIYNVYALCTKISISIATVFYPKSPPGGVFKCLPNQHAASSHWYSAGCVEGNAKSGTTDGWYFSYPHQNKLIETYSEKYTATCVSFCIKHQVKHLLKF